MKKYFLLLGLGVVFFMNSNNLSAQSNEEYISFIAKGLPKEYIKSNANLFFSIQIGAFKNINESLEKVDNINRFIEEDNLTKYRIGEFLTYTEAKDFKKMILTVCKDAFIIVYKNGRRIHIAEAFNQ